MQDSSEAFKKMALTCSYLSVVLLLLIPWASAQATQCAYDGSPQLRFVVLLNGCMFFVHDTGANDGPHLAIEPIMCVTESLHKVAPRYDPVTQQTYVSVPVLLRDDAMLTEVQIQLAKPNLKLSGIVMPPKSVKFATVSDISVSTDDSSKFQALGFIWSPEETVGFLRMGCKHSGRNCSVERLALRVDLIEALNQVKLYASVVINGTNQQLQYRPVMPSSNFFDINFYVDRFSCLAACQQLRFVRSMRFKGCSVRVHQRLDRKGHFLIEPLLCHNTTSMSMESVMYDYSLDMYYLKLDVVLQDDMAVDAVRTQLADLSPLSVTFMPLWRAQIHVASALSRRFEIGPLMVSGDEMAAQLRLFCEHRSDCDILLSAFETDPVDVWSHIKWSAKSLLPDAQCILEFRTLRHNWRMRETGAAQVMNDQNYLLSLKCPSGAVCRLQKTPDNRLFVIIQQRRTGRISFQRNWMEYESGFGDDADFWIGLSAIHSLSMNGATLRVEMKLWNGTELHAEYAGFKVGDASTNYTMTYREMLRDRSNVSFDAMKYSKGMQFSTMERDNDRWNWSCSVTWGYGGWWFNSCHDCNLNGPYYPVDVDGGWKYLSWYNGTKFATLRGVRLTLQL